MVAQVDRFYRGGIYLAQLDPAKGAEVGKLRPVLVLTDQVLLDVRPPILFVCPLSSRSDPAYDALHVALPPRDGLQRPSWALVEHCRAIATRRVLTDRLGSITDAELHEIVRRLGRMVGAT